MVSMKEWAIIHTTYPFKNMATNMNDLPKSFDPTPLCSILESIAKKYEPSSVEHAAVELAAKGIIYLQFAWQGPSFNQYLKLFFPKTSEEQLNILKQVGIRQP